MPGNIRFIPASPVPAGVTVGNQTANRKLPVPRVQDMGASGTLTVAGGGPSLARHLPSGRVWAINGTHRWLGDRGIDSEFFSIDPLPIIAEWVGEAHSAVLGDTCAPETFAAAKNIHMAELGPIMALCSTATTAPTIAAAAGFSHVRFVGCDGGIEGRSHVDRDEGGGTMRVVIGGRVFMTRPDLMMITEQLAELIRELPKFLSTEGDTMLSALVEHGDYEITHVSREIDARLRAENP